MNEESVMEVLPFQSNARLLENGVEYSDLIIRCGGTEFKVHRSVVFMQSEVLKRLHAELTTVDDPKAIEVVDVEEDVNVVKQVIDYMYTGDYYYHYFDTPSDYRKVSGSAHKSENWVSDMESKRLAFHTSMFLAAHKLEIHALKRYACKHYIIACPRMFNWSAFTESVMLLYRRSQAHPQNTKDQLRDTMAEFAAEAYQGFASSCYFASLATEFPDFAIAFAKALSFSPLESRGIAVAPPPMELFCPNCGEGETARSVTKQHAIGDIYYCKSCPLQFNINR